MDHESDPNWKAAKQRLILGKDPGGMFPDLRDEYRKQREESPRSAGSYQSPAYPSYESSSGYTSQSESKPSSSTSRHLSQPVSKSRTWSRSASGSSKASNSSALSLRGIFAFGGFIGGILLGIKIFPPNVSDSWIGILLIGLACAWLAAKSYKLIIGVGLLLVLGFVLLDPDKEPVKNESSKDLPQSAEYPSKSSLAPSAGDDRLLPKKTPERSKALSADEETTILGPEPVIKYAKLETVPKKSSADLQALYLLARIEYSFKNSADINLDAETCSDPWVFKDGKGTEMLCVPLQYFNKLSDGKPLDTPEKRKALFKGAANFSGNGRVATHGDYDKGAQILVPLELLRDEVFIKRFETTLPDLLKDADLEKQLGEDMNQRRIPTYVFGKDRNDKYAYVEYLEPKNVNEWSTRPIPAPAPERS